MAKSKKLNRRKFIKTAAAATAATAAFTSCASVTGVLGERNPASKSENGWQVNESDMFDFIIVGSGAGGGPLAAKLAKAEFKVLLIEAGSSTNNKLSETPVFHAKASDDPLLNWSYFVERYAAESKFRRFELLNSKYRKEHKGVYYPRASGIGGSTRVNALISLYPDHQDWDKLSKDNKDLSWGKESMFVRYNRMLKENGGWLKLSQANPTTLLQDWFLTKLAVEAIGFDAGSATAQNWENFFKFKFDKIDAQLKSLNPNDVEYINNKYNGVFNIPFNATDGVRRGVREYVLETEQQKRDKLFIKTESLCTRILFDKDKKTKAIGIEFIEGAHAYKADIKNQHLAKSSYVRKKAFAAKEVILAGGAFNTPQLLMLSGIGDKKSIPNSIPLVADLPGVGKNLQDRYEVTVISKLNGPIDLIKNCTFARDNNFTQDPCWNDYLKNKGGHIYGTNGLALSLIRKSSPDLASPDLAIFGLPGYFKGYYPDYSKDAVPKRPTDPNYFTWAILKGHTKNQAGHVTLKSDNPRDVPKINFSYFSEMDNGNNEDLNAVFEGLKIARDLNSKIGKGFIQKEIYPDKADSKDELALKSWIMKESWGHHASCTSKMGPASDPNAVVDNKFKVHGVQGLRIVDASVFAQIPGLFIMLPTLMISDKAAFEIISEYGGIFHKS